MDEGALVKVDLQIFYSYLPFVVSTADFKLSYTKLSFEVVTELFGNDLFYSCIFLLATDGEVVSSV